MNLEWSTDPKTGDIIFTGRISALRLQDLKFNKLERRAIASEPLTASDFLLDAEMIFRRHEEKTKLKQKNGPETKP
jgi:hypothetical protein